MIPLLVVPATDVISISPCKLSLSSIDPAADQEDEYTDKTNAKKDVDSIPGELLLLVVVHIVVRGAKSKG